MSTMKAFLRATEVIDWDHLLVRAKAQQLAEGSGDPQEISRRCFEWVRDNIEHSFDFKRNPVTCVASDVLRQGTGYCYAKSTCWRRWCARTKFPQGFATSG